MTPTPKAPAQSVQGVEAVAIKPLEWDDVTSDHVAPRVYFSRSITPFGNYRTASTITGKWRIIGPNGEALRDNRKTIIYFSKLEEAKAAVQADYEARIRSALLSRPQPETVGGEMGEPVAWILDWRFKKSGPDIKQAGGGSAIHRSIEEFDRHFAQVSALDIVDFVRGTPLYTHPSPAPAQDGQSEAVITEAMIEIGCETLHGTRHWRSLVRGGKMDGWIRSHRGQMADILRATLAGRS